MRTMRFPLTLLTAGALCLTLAAAAFAGTPQPSITGSATAPGIIDIGTDVTVMNQCPGPINNGWGIYQSVGWRVSQAFVPSVTATPVVIAVPCSFNGFSSFTITATVYTDAGGGIPGTPLFSSMPVTVNNPPNYPNRTIVRIRFTAPVPLTAGTSYVVVYDAPSGACFVDATGSDTCPGEDAHQSLDNGVTWSLLNSDIIRAIVAP
jgi:hypothetical protein